MLLLRDGKYISSYLVKESVKKNDRVIELASHPKNGDHIFINSFDLICGKQIKGSWGGSLKPDIEIPRIAKLYEKSKLPLEKRFTKRYILDNIDDALDDLEHRKTIRLIVEMKINDRFY